MHRSGVWVEWNYSIGKSESGLQRHSHGNLYLITAQKATKVFHSRFSQFKICFNAIGNHEQQVYGLKPGKRELRIPISLTTFNVNEERTQSILLLPAT